MILEDPDFDIKPLIVIDKPIRHLSSPQRGAPEDEAESEQESEGEQGATSARDESISSTAKRRC